MDRKSFKRVSKTSRSRETSENEIEQNQSIPAQIPFELWRRLQLQDDSSDSEEEMIDISPLIIMGHLMMLGDMLTGNYWDSNEEDERQSPRIWEIKDSDSNDEEVQQDTTLNTDQNRLLQQMKAHQSQVTSTQDSAAKFESTSQSTSLPATNTNNNQKKGKGKKKKKKKKKKKNSTVQQQVQQQSASKTAEQNENITQNISINEEDQSKLLTGKKNQDTESHEVDTQHSKDQIKSSTKDETEAVQISQTSNQSKQPDQSNGQSRTIIMAAQCETIRKTKDQINFDLATQGMTVCIAVYIADKIGNASLTHMDAGTSLDFIKREIDWIKNQNAATNFHIKDDLMIHVVENRLETANDPLGGITPVIQRYLQQHYANIKNLKGKNCYDTSNVDKGNVLFVTKLDQDGTIQYRLFQPLRQYLDEQFMHCTDGIQVSSHNPLRNYYIDKGQNYRDFDFRGATRGLMGCFRPINNVIVQGAKLSGIEYQAVVVYEKKWTNKFFDLPNDIQLKVNRSKGTTRMNEHQHDIVSLMVNNYWRCEENERQRAMKADENKLLQQIKAQQSQVKPTQDSTVEFDSISNQSTLSPTSKTDSNGKARRGQEKVNNPSAAQQVQHSTSTPVGQQEIITEAKESDQSKFIADKKNQDTANDEAAAGNSAKNCNNLQGFSRKMIMIAQHEGGLIDFNENNVDNISIATGGIVTCVAIIIGYKRMITRKDKIHPTISIMLAHVDTLTDLNFIQNRIQEIKRKDRNFKEENINIDIVKNPNHSVSVDIQEYLYNRYANIKNSKGLPCYQMRNSNNGTVLCEGVMENGQLSYKLFTPNEDDISHQLNYCYGLIHFPNKALKHYHVECGDDAETRVCIHQLNTYLRPLEHRNINKKTQFAGLKLDIIYNDGKWIESSIKLTDWCQTQTQHLEKYKNNDRKLQSEIIKLFDKCYRNSPFVMLPGDMKLNMIECMVALKNYWQAIEKTKVMEAIGIQTSRK